MCDYLIICSLIVKKGIKENLVTSMSVIINNYYYRFNLQVACLHSSGASRINCLRIIAQRKF